MRWVKDGNRTCLKVFGGGEVERSRGGGVGHMWRGRVIVKGEREAGYLDGDRVRMNAKVNGEVVAIRRELSDQGDHEERLRG